MKNYSNNELDNMINNYLTINKKYYPEYKIDILKEKFGKRYTDDMTQIYDVLDMYEDDSPYVGIANVVEQEFGIKKNILEIGSGIYPALANRISAKQVKARRGTITVYDKMIGIVSNPNLIVKREFITQYHDVSNYDLIIGKEPCMATETLISLAKHYKKDFLISPCNCYGLLPEYMEFNDDPIKQWYSYVKYMCLNDNNYKLKEVHLEAKYNYNNPIYVLKRTSR